MREQKRIFLLVSIWVASILIVGSVSLLLVYHAGIDGEKVRLAETARSQARLIEAVARHTTGYHFGEQGTMEALLLAQIREAHKNYDGLGETGELVLARREGDQIVFLLNHRFSGLDETQRLPFDSGLAEPMRRSLTGEFGTMIGLDYRGETVLAAYEPVSGLGWGIVAKIDLAEVRWPFIRSGLVAIGVGGIVVLLGASLFYRITNPLLDEMRESEARFRATFEQAAVGLAHVDLEGHYLRLNQRFCDIVGYSKQEMLKMTFQEITHPEDLPLDMEYIRKMLAGEIQTYSLEKRYIHKDGRVVWVNLTAALKRAVSGKVEYAIAAVEDISERKFAEMALRESEERFRGVFEQAAVGVSVVSEDGHFLKVNQRYCQIAGYSEEEMQRLTFQEITHPDDLKENLEQSRRLLDGEQDQFSLEKRFIQKNGHVVWIRLAVTLVESKLEHRKYFISIVEDITEQKKAGEALRASEARYAHLAENIPGVIYQYLQKPDDLSGEFLFISPRVKAVCGLEPEEVMRDGSLMWSLIHPDDLEDFRQSMAKAENESEPWSYEWRILPAGGGEKWMKGISQPNRQENGSIQWDGVILNITDQKQAETLVQEQENRFRLLIDTSPLPVTVLDQDKKIIYLNRSFKKVFGYTLEEIQDMDTWRKLAYPDEVYRDERYRFWEQTVAFSRAKNTAIQSTELQVTCKDGSKKIVLASTSVIGDNILIIYTDLTAQKELEFTLRESEERYRSLVENTDDLIYTLDSDLCHTAVNRAFCDVLGMESEEIIGKNDEELGFPPELARDWADRYRRVLDTGEAEHFEVETPLPGGRVSIYEVNLVPTFDSDGRVTGIRGVDRDITNRKNAETQIQRQLERISALHNIDLAISSSLDLDFTLDVILNQVINQLRVDASDILLYDPLMQTLKSAARNGFWISQSDFRVRLGRSLAGRAALERKTIRVANLSDTPEKKTYTTLISEERFVAYFGVPLIAKGELKGVLEIFHRSPLNVDDEWTNFLDVLARQAAIAIDNAALFSNLQKSNSELRLAYDTTLEGWANALELRDHETEGHSRRVAEMTNRLARAMGISEQEIIHIQRGAMLHDIGKVGIPDRILSKPGPLTDEEWTQMKQHPVFARKLLSKIPYLQKALEIPYSHHERWDGSGYPEGLSGEHIPLPARIFAVVDVWDALTSDRPYREAWPEEKTLNYIREQAGKLFDPQVVEIFLRIYNQEDR